MCEPPFGSLQTPQAHTTVADATNCPPSPFIGFSEAWYLGHVPTGWGVEDTTTASTFFGYGSPSVASVNQSWFPFPLADYDAGNSCHNINNGASIFAPGDYVRIVGTLWQDGYHNLNQVYASRCWSGIHEPVQDTYGYGHWEMHPVDYMAKLAAPYNPTTVSAYSLCTVNTDGNIARLHRSFTPGPMPSLSQPVLNLSEQLDTKFSHVSTIVPNYSGSILSRISLPNTYSNTPSVSVNLEVQATVVNGIATEMGKAKTIFEAYWAASCDPGKVCWLPDNYTGSGSFGQSGICLQTASFPVTQGNSYTISNCGSNTGDSYLRVDGACTCANDDYCGRGSLCSCYGATTGSATICASTYGSSAATWSYQVTMPVSFAGSDSRRSTASGDWDPYYYKGECASNETVSGVSMNAWTRQALCRMGGGLQHPVGCYRRTLDQGDSRGTTSTGDWAYSYVKMECGPHEYVAGISVAANHLTHAVLCCPGVVSHTNCTAHSFDVTDSLETPSSGYNWSPSNTKAECGRGRYLTGLSTYYGTPHSLLCCD